MKYLLIILTILTHNISIGRNNPDIVPNEPSKPQLTARVGKCVQGKANIDLDVNNVRARLLNTGDLWWDRTNAKYGVPKLTPEQIKFGQRQANPLFAGAVWISGKVAGNLRMAALRYSNGSSAFWPGVIETVGNSDISADVCDKFDKFWKVTGDEIDNAIQKGIISESIKNWPGKGNPQLIANGVYTAQELSDRLAPFYDHNGNGIYDPMVIVDGKGDLPAIKHCGPGPLGNGLEFTYANEMIFWVINDIGNNHVAPASTPIGVQMNCLAFAFISNDDLHNMTFYTYEIHNKSNVDLDQTYMTQYMDADLGNFSDDLIGCDTSRAMGYVYNGDDYDDDGNPPGYKENVPIFGVDFFEGPRDANGKQLGMSSFVYYVNGANGPNSDPITEVEYRNYQEGKTRTGQSFTISSDCLKVGSPTTKHCFSGDPSKTGEWSMCQEGNKGADYRFAQNSGPFTMTSGSFETITIGLVFVQPPAGSQSTCRPVMSKLQKADDKAQRLFDFNFKKSSGPDAPELKIQELENQLNFTIENLPGSNNFGEKYNAKNIDVPTTMGNKDTTYRFEGYLIYQLASANAISTYSDLGDDAKAKLVKIMDVKNNVINAANFTREVVNGQNITTIQDAFVFPNQGIEREFTIKDDKFQQEGKKFLVNNKTYYYAVIAVAFNNFKTPIDSQTKQIISSDKIKIFSGTPHNSDFWGIKTNAKFGDFLNVKRIQGQGHGNYFLNILKSDADEIVANNSKQEITYLGGESPIVVKVNDPYSLKNVDFRLTIMDDNNLNPEKFVPSSSRWELLDKTNNVTIASERSIERQFNQSIYAQVSGALQSYGISVGLGVADSIGKIARSGRAHYDYIGGSIKYEDSSKKWLTFLADVNGEKWEDWIRSGSTNDQSGKFTSSYNYIGAKRYYTDSLKAFSNILGGTWAPYCLAANTNILGNIEENQYQSYGPGFKWKRLTTDSNTMATYGEGPENNLDSIFSFDLVITKDKTKWSKSVVLETGEATQFNEFGAIKGQIRRAPSVDVDGNISTNDGIGLGYFPGYAINLETGERVNVYFGENSRFRGKNGGNMVWDPDSIKKTVLGGPIYGGSQFIYVMNTPYSISKVESDRDMLTNPSNFNITTGAGTTMELNKTVANFYRGIAWTCVPISSSKYPMYDANGNYTIPTDITVKIRVQKPYAFYQDGGSMTSIYEFSTNGMAPVKKQEVAQSAFDKMTIVPNPYNAYSIYESSAAQNIIKIVNVPKNSTVSIFTTDGILVRRLKLNENTTATFSGANVDDINNDNAITWDMRTSSGVLIASGTYYINVESPTLGSKVLKLFATMRSADVSNF